MVHGEKHTGMDIQGSAQNGRAASAHNSSKAHMNYTQRSTNTHCSCIHGTVDMHGACTWLYYLVPAHEYLFSIPDKSTATTEGEMSWPMRLEAACSSLYMPQLIRLQASRF